MQKQLRFLTCVVAVLLLTCSAANAVYITTPYVFVPFTTIVAQQVNADFAAYASVINGQLDNSNLSTSAQIRLSQLNQTSTFLDLISSTSQLGVGVGQSGDTYARGGIYGDGSFAWGAGGSSAADVGLGRSAVGQIQLYSPTNVPTSFVFNGSTSGSVQVGAQAVAGTGTVWNFPATNGTAGAVATGDGTGNVNWAPSGIGLLGTSNPNGSVSGTAGGYYYDTTHAVQYVCTTTGTTWVRITEPVGTMRMLSPAGYGANTIPTGWALCNGSTVNGVVTPNMIGMFPLGGQPTAYGSTPNTNGFGANTIDADTGTTTHTHSLTFLNNGRTDASNANTNPSSPTNATTYLPASHTTVFIMRVY